MGKQWLFDRPRTRAFTEARQAFTRDLLRAVRQDIDLRSALDTGCGVGDFSSFLSEMGFRVVAIDGREENINEARRRHPEVIFNVGNVEDLPIGEKGFDLVLCFGILYHLENPFRAVRRLQLLTEKLLLVESMCVPGPHSTMALLDELKGEDQALDCVAFYPSEPCIIKMLYRAGFSFVYRFARLPQDELYEATIWRKRARTFLAASKVPLNAPNLVLAKEPVRLALEFGPWDTALTRFRRASLTRFQKASRSLWHSFADWLANTRMRIPRFLRRPLPEKREILSFYLRRLWDRVSLGGTK